MGNSPAKESCDEKMFIRKMEVVDIEKVDKLLKPYFDDKDAKSNFHLSIVPASILLISNEIVVNQEYNKYGKYDDDDSDKNTSLLKEKLDKKKEQTIIGYSSIFMLPRSKEEKKQILEAMENGWLIESPPEKVPTIHTFVISSKINQCDDEIYSTFLIELKNYVKTGYRTLDYSFDCAPYTTTFTSVDTISSSISSDKEGEGEEKATKGERAGKMIDIFKKQGFKIISKNETGNGKLNYRLRCLLI